MKLLLILSLFLSSSLLSLVSEAATGECYVTGNTMRPHPPCMSGTRPGENAASCARAKAKSACLLNPERKQCREVTVFFDDSKEILCLI